MKGFGPERRGSLGEVLRRTITRICRTYWRALAGFLIVGIGQLSIGLYAIVLLQRLLDAIPAARSLSDLARPLALYAGATLLNHLLIYLDGYPRAILSHGAYHWVKAQALRKVATVDYLAYQELSTGRLIERVEQGASATRRVLMNFWLALARNFVPQIAISLILVRRYDAALCAVFVGMVIVLSVLSNVLMRALRRQVERMLAHQESLTRYSVREIVGLVVFRVNSRFSHELRRPLICHHPGRHRAPGRADHRRRLHHRRPGRPHIADQAGRRPHIALQRRPDAVQAGSHRVRAFRGAAEPAR